MARWNSQLTGFIYESAHWLMMMAYVRQNHNGNIFKEFGGTSTALDHTVLKKSNSHISCNKLSKGSSEHIAGAMAGAIQTGY